MNITYCDTCDQLGWDHNGQQLSCSVWQTTQQGKISCQEQGMASRQQALAQMHN